MSIIIGIDNGITGGLCAISAHHGLIIATSTMPSIRHRKRNEIDIRRIHIWLSEVTNGNLSNADYVIEEPNNSRNASTAYSVASSFHSMRGFFETKMLAWHRITPQSWQRAMLGKVPAGETKAYALAKARELWPDEKWLATERCSKPHEGMIDAALIAEYWRRREP
jgi:hypothetical protein